MIATISHIGGILGLKLLATIIKKSPVRDKVKESFRTRKLLFHDTNSLEDVDTKVICV